MRRTNRLRCTVKTSNCCNEMEFYTLWKDSATFTTAFLWPQCSVMWMLILEYASEMLDVQWVKLLRYTHEEIKINCPFWTFYSECHWEECNSWVLASLLQIYKSWCRRNVQNKSPWLFLGLNLSFVLAKQFLGTINLSSSKTVIRVILSFHVGRSCQSNNLVI